MSASKVNSNLSAKVLKISQDGLGDLCKQKCRQFSSSFLFQIFFGIRLRAENPYFRR